MIVKAQSAGILSIFQTFDFSTFTATVCLEKVLKNIYFDAQKMADFPNGIIDLVTVWHFPFLKIKGIWDPLLSKGPRLTYSIMQNKQIQQNKRKCN